MLASVGRAEVEIWRKPRVAIISSGNEIVSPGHWLRPGEWIAWLLLTGDSVEDASLAVAN
jgi:molybdopterin biosynthesis enzyme